MLLFPTHSKIRLVPASLKCHTRMPNGKTNRCNDNHCSLENHQSHLVICELAVESVAQLGDSVARADEDADRRDGQA